VGRRGASAAAAPDARTDRYVAHDALEKIDVDAERREAVVDPEAETLDVHMTTQMPHVGRDLLANTLDLPPEQVRVAAPDVGGGFGVKALPYPEHVALTWAATTVDQPVKWIAGRTESHLGNHHGRDFRAKGSFALDEDGHVRAAFTNTAPVAPYRGAGRPEIIYLIERLMGRAAAELEVDPETDEVTFEQYVAVSITTD
jgi:carbon-monoxide dehydrogenase large subunit